MDEEIYVSCHAPSLSLLLYETARSVHDQKGLLIGQICNEVISRKTDENEVNREHKTAIYLEHCIPLDDQDLIGNAGLINKTKLQKYIDVLENKIVGWYSFRRNSRLVPNSLSEMLIHHSLLELLPNTKCQYFIACFMSSTVAANLSTHVFNHLFTTFDPVRARFEPLRLKIYTLSDKSVNSNGYLMKNPFPTSSNFDKIINYVQKEETPVKSVLAIHERVGEVLKFIDKKLQNIENHRVLLEQEVETLKRKLAVVNKQVVVIRTVFVAVKRLNLTTKSVFTLQKSQLKGAIKDFKLLNLMELPNENLTEISVEEPKKEELVLKTVQFDSKVKYNSNRKTNPLNSIVVKPIVPAEKQEEKHRRCPSIATKPAKQTVGKKSSNSLKSNCDAGGTLDTDNDALEERIVETNIQPPKYMN